MKAWFIPSVPSWDKEKLHAPAKQQSSWQKGIAKADEEDTLDAASAYSEKVGCSLFQPANYVGTIVNHPEIMTLSEREQASDKRLWVALFLAFLILAITTFRNLEQAAPPVSSLAIINGELHLVAENVSGRTEANRFGIEAVADVAPFFFAPVPVNRADKPLLMTLPGIGEGLAQRIIAHRSAKGPIANEAEFSQIKGIGKKRIEAIRYAITFE